MANLVLEILEEAQANGENRLTEDQVAERLLQGVLWKFAIGT